MKAAVSCSTSATGIMQFEIKVLTAVPGKLGTVCGIYGGEKGCCPIGENCSGVSGCQNSDDVPCTDYCCPSGTSCAKDNTGAGTCSTGSTDDTGNTDNSQCDAGYSACTQFDGCCPTGTQCVLPKNCDIPCASDDPICGTGCCKKGTYCTSKGTCAKDEDSFTTLVQTTRIITTQTTELPTEEPTEELTTDLPTETPTDYPSTETTDTSSSPTDILPNDSDSTSISTTPRVPTTTATRRTIATVNAAPTMGAMLGGGLGMAAGVLGVLAM